MLARNRCKFYARKKLKDCFDRSLRCRDQNHEHSVSRGTRTDLTAASLCNRKNQRWWRRRREREPIIRPISPLKLSKKCVRERRKKWNNSTRAVSFSMSVVPSTPPDYGIRENFGFLFWLNGNYQPLSWGSLVPVKHLWRTLLPTTKEFEQRTIGVD